jgi:TolB-like protein/cytochrome c-type biogenesis protein CcmH/NrfG
MLRRGEPDRAGDGGIARIEPSSHMARAQLERVLASGEFVASQRLRMFLQFVVEEALAGRAKQLKAYTIAIAALGRDPAFDSQNDPIVRMQAGRLRRRLERYYLGAGRSDPVRIEIPKGTYAPTFTLLRDAARADEAREGSLLSRKRPWSHGLCALGALVVAALVLIAMISLQPEAPRSEAEASLPAAQQERGPAAIVLPFEDLSGSNDGGIFARGLTEELISNLMRFDELRLYSAHGSFLERPTADPLELGARLDVGYVVKGSVRRTPDQIRLIAHLIDARTREFLWSGAYDRPLTPANVFVVQEQLAAHLASQLAQPYGIINEVTAASFRQQRPKTLFAYDCVLRVFDYRRIQGRARHAAARACLEEAVRRDPEYADAWALLADNYLDEFRYGYDPRPYDPAALTQATQTARHAVDLDPDNVHGLLALSMVHFYRREFAEADEINRRLLSLKPTNPEVLGQVGWRTALAKDWDEGIALIRRAIDRSVKAPWGYHLFIAFDHYRRGDYEAALAEADPIAATGMVQIAFLLAAVHGQLGHQYDARHSLDRARALDATAVEQPRAWLRRHNMPEDLVEHLIDGLTKAGLRTT